VDSASRWIFLGWPTLILSVGVYAYNNLGMCVLCILNKYIVHWNLQFTIISFKLYIFSSLISCVLWSYTVYPATDQKICPHCPCVSFMLFCNLQCLGCFSKAQF
jgi:hypothetical protein